MCGATMTTELNPYHELSMEQALALKEEYDRRYWQAVDFLGLVTMDRATLYNHIGDMQREASHE